MAKIGYFASGTRWLKSEISGRERQQKIDSSGWEANCERVPCYDLLTHLIVSGPRFVVTGLFYNGVGTNFGVGIGEARPKGPRAGDGVLGKGQPAPPHQLGGLRECCKLPQCGPG